MQKWRKRASVIAEVRTEEGKLHPYVGIDLTSKFAFAERHTILTDNGIPFADLPRNRDG